MTYAVVIGWLLGAYLFYRYAYDTGGPRLSDAEGGFWNTGLILLLYLAWPLWVAAWIVCDIAAILWRYFKRFRWPR